MSKEAEEPRYHIIQPLRDPESNWAVDLAKDLEEYLVKICSGDVTGDDEGHLSINFAEAALILQGSVQVYSRKVEYLYKLVLQALEVLSQKRFCERIKEHGDACPTCVKHYGSLKWPNHNLEQQDQTEESSAIPEGHDSNSVLADENEPFLGLDDVPVDAKSCLDDGRTKGHTSNQFVKPPANLVVLEGDCFDSIGDVGELESYLLATHDLYRDFILLDPYDAGSVDTYLEEEDFGGNNVAQRGSQVKAKTPRSAFLSPSRQFGGTALKSPLAKSVGKNANRTPEITRNAEINDNIWPDPSAGFGFPENDYHGEDDNDGYPESMDESDDDEDPWRPLNPHETGNLKVKPFQKVKIRRRLKVTTNKLTSLASQFPVARLHGVINPEYKDIWETQLHEKKSVQESEALPLYEKLRQSLAGNDNFDTFTNHVEDNDDNEDENDAPDFGEADFTMPESSFMDAAGPLNHEMKDGPADFDNNGFETEDPDFQISLEDLCRSHLDALLASIAETEKQTELAARVSTWKQRIEGTLEEQDSHPPFDIQEYGERVLNKLSLEGESGNGMSFADVVRGQEKHDVARTFSALLQLVNNRSVDLDRGECSSQSVCYTAVNPFYVRPLTQSHINRTENMIFRSKKRGKSPMLKSVSKTARKKSYL